MPDRVVEHRSRGAGKTTEMRAALAAEDSVFASALASRMMEENPFASALEQRVRGRIDRAENPTWIMGSQPALDEMISVDLCGPIAVKKLPRPEDVEIDTDLMALVRTAETPTALALAFEKIAAANSMAVTLRNAGFEEASMMVSRKIRTAQATQAAIDGKYPVITPEKITAFLARLANDYNKKYATGQQARVDTPTCLVALTEHLHEMRGGIGRFRWDEVVVADYTGIPPESVIGRLVEVAKKKIFDVFTVATVEHVKDPLLLGRINGCDNAFFLAQWGDDIKLDDVI